MTITKAETTDAGCWIDGHWGQYGIARAIEIAHNHGFEDDELVGIATRKMDECVHPGVDNDITDQEHEILSDAADEIDAWMTENVAPEGYSFGWFDMEWSMQPDEWWEE